MATKPKNRRERRAQASIERKRRPAGATGASIDAMLARLTSVKDISDLVNPDDGEDDEDDEDGEVTAPEADDYGEADMMGLFDGLNQGEPDGEEGDDTDDGEEDKDADEGVEDSGTPVNMSAEQLDAIIDSALGIDDNDDVEEVPAEMSVAAKNKKRAQAAAKKHAAAKRLVAAVSAELAEVKLPASAKAALIRVMVKERLETARAEVARKSAQVAKKQKAQEIVRANGQKAISDMVNALVEEKLMTTRPNGRGYNFGGYAPESKSFGGNRGMASGFLGGAGQAPAFNRTRRGVGFKMVDLLRAMNDREFGYQYLGSKGEFKALGGATGSAGGYIVPEEWTQDFIRLLRAKAVIRNIARIVPMSNDTLHYPKQTGAAVANWVGEGTDVSASAQDQTFSELVFTAHKLVAFSIASNELLNDSPYNAEKIIRDDLLQVVKLAEDLAFMFGSGTGATPKGIYNFLLTANKLAGTGSTNALIVDDLYRVMNRVEKNNANLDCWLTSADGLQVVRTLKDNTGNLIFSAYEGANAPQVVIESPYGEDVEDYNVPVGKILGRDVYITNQIPSTVTIAANAPTTTTGGTATLLFGGEKRQLMIGQRMQLEIAASNVAGNSFQFDQTYFRAILREDFQVGIPGAWAAVAFPIGA